MSSLLDFEGDSGASLKHRGQLFRRQLHGSDGGTPVHCLLPLALHTKTIREFPLMIRSELPCRGWKKKKRKRTGC